MVGTPSYHSQSKKLPSIMMATVNKTRSSLLGGVQKNWTTRERLVGCRIEQPLVKTVRQVLKAVSE